MNNKGHQQQIGLPRYLFPDAYTVEELRGRYVESSAAGRIRLLRELLSVNPTLPQEIGSLAAKDDSAAVRRWLAKHGHSVDRHVQELKGDPDPFVRACLFENSLFMNYLLDKNGREIFESASKIERLALVRNPASPILGLTVVENLFDLKDQSFALSFEDRRELVLAFLCREGCLKYLEEKGFFGDLDRMWDLASRWPQESLIPSLVYLVVPVSPWTREKVYQSCDSPGLRAVILMGSRTPSGLDLLSFPVGFGATFGLERWKLAIGDGQERSTLLLGMKDSDANCRRIACARVPQPPKEVVETILASQDTDALWGLAHNQSLPYKIVLRLGARLDELGEKDKAHEAYFVAEEEAVRKADIPG